LTHREYREFRDSSGIEWKAYRVEPQLVSPALEHLRRSLPLQLVERRQPWLLFESKDERRRLSPVPPEWDGNSTDADLERWCATADRIPPAPAQRADDRMR
jgi:hypothetical protein